MLFFSHSFPILSKSMSDLLSQSLYVRFIQSIICHNLINKFLYAHYPVNSVCITSCKKQSIIPVTLNCCYKCPAYAIWYTVILLTCCKTTITFSCREGFSCIKPFEQWAVNCTCRHSNRTFNNTDVFSLCINNSLFKCI